MPWNTLPVGINTYSKCLLKPGAHLGGLFRCHDRPLCTAGTQH